MDLVPFVNRLQIVTKDLRVVQLGDVLNHAQYRIVDEVNTALNDRRRCRFIVLKARQIGVSTIVEGLMFSLAMILNRMGGLVISHEADSASWLLKMTNHYWETWKFRSLYNIRHNSVRHMSWDDNGSSIRIATAKNVGAGRSTTIQFLHGSEVAFWDDAVTLMTGLAQSIPMTSPSIIALESTANGIGGYFYDQWNAAVDGETEFTPLFFPWHEHPEYTVSYLQAVGAEHVTTSLGALNDEERVLKAIGISDDRLAWRRWAIRNLTNNDLMRFKQEYPCVVGQTRVPSIHGLLPISECEGLFSHWADQGVKRTIELVTDAGYTVICTPDHEVFAGGEWVEASDTLNLPLTLEPVTFAEKPHWASLTDFPSSTRLMLITPEWGEWLGLFMGDGSCSWRTISLVSDARDSDVIERWEKLCESLLGITPARRVVGSKSGGIEQRFSSDHVRGLLDDLGCLEMKADDRTTRKVCVPDAIWRSPRPVVEAFVRGVMESDAHNYSRQHMVKLFTKHEQFAKDMQLLLWGLGYQSRRRQEDKGTYVGHAVILGGVEAYRYNTEVGWIGQRKAARTPTPSDFRPVKPPVVTQIVKRGRQRVYDITTPTGYFSGNGLKVHNCVPEEAFIVTGHNIFPDGDLTACYTPMNGLNGYLVEEGGRVRFQESIDGPLTIFRWPGEDMDRHKYMVSGDATRSITGDFSCAQVLNRRTWEQVAIFRKKIDPVSFGDQLALLGRYYNWAIVCPEIQGAGDSTISRLISLNYPFLFEHRKAERIPGQPETVFGWWSGVRAKQEAIGNLLKVVVDHDLILHDHKTYAEMRAYVSDEKGGFKNGAGERHDDTVTAMAIAMTCTMYEAANINASMGVYGGSRVGEMAGSVNRALQASGMNVMDISETGMQDVTQDSRLLPWETGMGVEDRMERVREQSGVYDG